MVGLNGLCGAAALLLALSAAAAEPAVVPVDSALSELSGLAVSRADPALLYGHNDSWNPPQLFQLDPSGKLLRTFYLQGLQNLDWEDIAAFTFKGQPALLLGDIGDDFALRDHLRLYALSDPGAAGRPRLLWTLEFRFPDGARDAEALAVDEARHEILLISKRDAPPRLYRLPLPDGPPPKGMQVAEALGTIAGLPQPRRDDPPEIARAGRYRSMVTALDLARDGSRAVVLTPVRAYLYRHRGGESWAQSFARAPVPVAIPPMPQAEAAAFSADGGTLYLGSEAGATPAAGFARVPLPP